MNRVWAELVGRGFVNPVDDFRQDNPASHPKTLDFLADEFVASGFDFRFLVATIVRTDAYQRGHLLGTVPAAERLAAEKAFTATPVRRMGSEAMFDSIVQAGHLFTPKHRPGENVVTVVTYQQVAVAVKDDPTKPGTKPKFGGDKMAGPAMKASNGYDLEKGIEVDFKDALKKKDVLELDKMNAKSAGGARGRDDDEERHNAGRHPRAVHHEGSEDPRGRQPAFHQFHADGSPGSAGHFLRVFGQTDRAALDERRDHSPSMRQALMMLNGKLTNEAARVGPLEPVVRADRRAEGRRGRGDQAGVSRDADPRADRRGTGRREGDHQGRRVARSTAWPTSAGLCSTATSSGSFRDVIPLFVATKRLSPNLKSQPPTHKGFRSCEPNRPAAPGTA